MRISDWSSDVCSSYRAYCLWQHPDQRQLLIDDPSLIGNAVEETLRFDGSSQIIVRRAGKDVTMRGKTIPEGARIGQIGRASGGKECVRTCRSRWSPDTKKKKT